MTFVPTGLAAFTKKGSARTISGTGTIIPNLSVTGRESLTVEVTGVGPTNQIDIKANIEGAAFVTVWTIIGEMPIKAINVSKFDNVQAEVVVFDSVSSPSLNIAVSDSNLKEDFENVVVQLTENSINYTASTKEPTADQSHPVWRVKRDFTSAGATTTQFANDGYYTEIFSNKENIFPPAPLINNFSVDLDGTNDFLTFPTDPTVDFDVGTNAFSLSIWVKRATSIVLRSFFSTLDIADSPTFPGMSLFGSTTTVSFLAISDNSASETVNKSWTVNETNNQWTNYVLTNDGSGTAAGVNLYKDGVLLTGTVANDNYTTTTANANPWLIGGLFTGVVLFPYLGNLDEPSIWNIELSQTDVNTIFNDRKPSDLLIHPKVLEVSTRLPYYIRCGDDSGDVFPTIVNKGSTGATLNTTMTNMDASDFEEDVP